MRHYFTLFFCKGKGGNLSTEVMFSSFLIVKHIKKLFAQRLTERLDLIVVPLWDNFFI